jgi:hypothetical protein
VTGLRCNTSLTDIESARPQVSRFVDWYSGANIRGGCTLVAASRAAGLAGLAMQTWLPTAALSTLQRR